MPTSSPETQTLFVFDTELTADCVEWCPTNTSYVVCGTYILADESKQLKKGRLYLFRQSNDSLVEVKSARIDDAAIFDIKWCHHLIHTSVPHNDVNDHEKIKSSLLGQADADGFLKVYSFNSEVEESFTLLSKSKLFNNGVSCLSLDWNTKLHPSIQPLIAVSHSNGHISLNQLTANDLQISTLSSWKAHDYEAWVSAFDYHDTNIIFSGGDDSLFKGWDTRIASGKPTFTSKYHNAGVCSIQSNHIYDKIVASGSYDEKVYIWDTRKLKTPLQSICTGGGVWRIKWHPKNPNLLVTASMHNGFKIIQIDKTNITDYEHHKEIKNSNLSLHTGCSDSSSGGSSSSSSNNHIIFSYSKHSSIAYGVDWCLNPKFISCEPFAEHYVCSCSFYDHSMHFWKTKKI